jgi:hypothetical protein
MIQLHGDKRELAHAILLFLFIQRKRQRLESSCLQRAVFYLRAGNLSRPFEKESGEINGPDNALPNDLEKV